MEEEKKEEVKEVGETPPTEAQPEEEEKKEEVPAAGNPVISHPEVMLKLICDDGEIPEISSKIAFQSKMIFNCYEDSEEKEIAVPGIKLETMQKVVLYCEHINTHAIPEIEHPLTSAKMLDLVDEWYDKYIDLHYDLIFDLIIAANTLDVPSLIQLGSAKIASMMKGKKAAEIREIFNLENDFTPEEEKQILEENEWLLKCAQQS